eukprot:UN00611
MKKKFNMDEKRMFILFYRICQALNELHKHKPKWAHRDIKLENVLLADYYTPMLMDFGSVATANITNR